MKIYKTKIKDLLVIKQKNNVDKRGSLRETFNKNYSIKNLFLNIVLLPKKCFKGFHFQIKFQQAKQ